MSLRCELAGVTPFRDHVDGECRDNVRGYARSARDDGDESGDAGRSPVDRRLHARVDGARHGRARVHDPSLRARERARAPPRHGAILPTPSARLQ